ncbi:hypothetical protein FACS189483_10230 [Spirochaetia bacterium]|nr:hypothetical protein FACS189483_10230 [Spirochaetia bacterium]
MQAKKRISDTVIATLRTEILDAGGNEVFALGFLDDAGLVVTAEVLARGNAGAVLALRSRLDTPNPPDVLIHNHPSGFLAPSDNDLSIASRAADAGTGCFIINNEVTQVYVVAEPTRRKVRKKLNAERICAALEEGGAIAKRLPSFEIRPSQLDLMRIIIRGFNDDALVAAEAGTGVGKSFAYLLPAMRYALDNEERIVISTATITLQQQLYEKDIPLVASAIGKDIKVVLMKGRGNYLCRRRLEDALREPVLDEDENDALRAIVAWTETSKTGSRSDLSFLPPEGLWSRICSEADTCMGMRCPERERCFFLALRKECADARILVVNHHLLFADLAARYEGAGYEGTVVLPPYKRVVIDEAHTVESAATSFFSSEFSRLSLYRQLGRLYRRRRAQRSGLLLRLASMVSDGAVGEIDAPGKARPGDFAGARLDAASDAIEKIRGAADDLDIEALELMGAEGTFRLTPAREAAISAVLTPRLLELRRDILALAAQIREMLENLNDGNEDDPTVWEVKAIVRRLESIASVCSAFMEYRERPQEVMWLERHRAAASGSDWVQFTATP